MLAFWVCSKTKICHPQKLEPRNPCILWKRLVQVEVLNQNIFSLIFICCCWFYFDHCSIFVLAIDTLFGICHFCNILHLLILQIRTLFDPLKKYWPSLSCSSPSTCHGAKGSFWAHEVTITNTRYI